MDAWGHTLPEILDMTDEQFNVLVDARIDRFKEQQKRSKRGDSETVDKDTFLKTMGKRGKRGRRD